MNPLEKAIKKAASEQYPTAPPVSQKSECEGALLAQMIGNGFVQPVPQHKFAPGRKFAFDFAWPDLKIAIEVEGGLWMRGGGGHSHPMHILRDIEKSNLAAALGWRIFRFTTDMVRKNEAIAFLIALDPDRKNLRKDLTLIP